MLRIISINLNGIRAAARKGFYDWLPQQQADFICMQELKAQHNNLTEEMLNPEGYHGFFHCAERKGYSGVGLYARQEPDNVTEGIGIPELDAEGRYLELEYPNLAVISLYMPSGSSGEHRQVIKFQFMEVFFKHLKKLRESGKEIIICGDWNIAHHEIDLKNWRNNRKNSGFLPEERAWLTQVLDELDWVDVFRWLYPEAEGEGYTWWSNRGQARANNVGWRIDYQIATPGLGHCATHGYVYKEERFSDHAPLIIDYKWP